MKHLKPLAMLAFVGAIAFTSCNSATTEKTEEKLDTIGEKIDNAVDNLGNRVDSMGKNDKEDDADFVRSAAKDNAMELHMLQMGITNGTSKELKDAARKMQTDHKKMAQELKDYAAKNNIILDSTDKMDHSSDKTKGADWDKEWVDDMVEDHEKVIKNFEKEQDEVLDPALKTMIVNTLPTLRNHLESSKALQEKMKK